MSSDNQRGFITILGNRSFVRLWVAQTIGLAAQNGIHFVQMVVIERLTGSSTHMGLMILAFSLPGVFFSAFAGVVVDRLPKKLILLIATILRVILIAAYVVALRLLDGWQVLVALYTVTFVISSIAQFFAPALWAKVPLVIGEDNLLAANALFNLTYAIAQAAGLIVLAPLAVKLIGIEMSFLAIAATYLIASVLIALLPGDKPSPRTDQQSISPVDSAWKELRDGWKFIVSQRGIYMPMAQLTLIATLVMVMAMLAPGFSARVLGMAAEDAVYVFAPAGAGMLVATVVLGRFSRFLKRETWINFGLIGTAAGFASLGLVSRSHVKFAIPLFEIYPDATISVTTSIMGIALFTGFFIATINTVAQTALQERSPAHIRGRVYSVQFMLSNLVGIPPLLGLGTMADHLGIPIVCFALALLVVIVWATSFVHAIRLRRSEEQAVFAEDIERDRIAGRNRVLIITSRNDRGVQAAAHALAKAFQRTSSPSHVTVRDGADLLAAIPRLLVQFYRPRVTRGSWLWRALYTPESTGRLIGPIRWLTRSTVRHTLRCDQPSAIVCLDPVFLHLVVHVNQEQASRAVMVAVVTDLIRLHPLWLCQQVDLCIVPSDAGMESAVSAGMPREIMRRIGIPVSERFGDYQPDKSLVRQRLGWPLDRPTILMMSGRGDHRNFVDMARAIARSRLAAQLVIVIGRDSRFFGRLERIDWETPTRILRFIDNLPDLMLGASLIVTKGGSSIVAEALAARLPIIFIRSRMQERATLSYAVSAGVGVIAESPDQLVTIIREWLRPGSRYLTELSDHARELAQPSAAQEIAREVSRLMNLPSGARDVISS